MSGIKGQPTPGNPNISDYGFGGKYRTREEDDEYRSRIKGVPKRITWTKDKCVEELNDILDILKKILKEDEKIEIDDKRKLKNENIRDVTTLMNKILDYMKYLYPPVQQNVNLNVDITADAVLERLKNWKKKKIEEGEIIVEKVDEEK